MGNGVMGKEGNGGEGLRGKAGDGVLGKWRWPLPPHNITLFFPRLIGHRHPGETRSPTARRRFGGVAAWASPRLSPSAR